MRHNDQARFELSIQLQHEIQHLLAIAGIEVTGRLICQHQSWTGYQRACDGGTLALTPDNSPGL